MAVGMRGGREIVVKLATLKGLCNPEQPLFVLSTPLTGNDKTYLCKPARLTSLYIV